MVQQVELFYFQEIQQVEYIIKLLFISSCGVALVTKYFTTSRSILFANNKI
jgi:hypothetical protein